MCLKTNKKGIPVRDVLFHALCGSYNLTLQLNGQHRDRTDQLPSHLNAALFIQRGIDWVICVLRHTYNTSETVTKDVVINQAPSGGSLAPEEHTYIFCLNSSGSDAQTADGVAYLFRQALSLPG